MNTIGAAARRQLALLIISLLVLGTLAGVLSPRLTRWLHGPMAEGIPMSLDDPACQPVGIPCSASVPGLAIALYLGQEVQPLKTFPVEVITQGPVVDAVEIEFTMDGMDMGLARFRLRLQPNGTWRGQALLPVCTTGSREWRAEVSTHRSSQIFQASFHFSASH